MSQLSAQSIRNLCTNTDAPLITPFSEKRLVINGKSAGLSAASYDCRIDHDLVLGVAPGEIINRFIKEGRRLVDPRTGYADPYLQSALEDNPPMRALAYTVEDFHFPDNVSGAVCDKSSFARVFVSAFNTFFDPGFKGNATLELVNLGDEPVIYKKGDPVCQFLFQWLDATTDRPYSGKYQHQTKAAHAARYEIA